MSFLTFGFTIIALSTKKIKQKSAILYSFAIPVLEIPWLEVYSSYIPTNNPQAKYAGKNFR